MKTETFFNAYHLRNKIEAVQTLIHMLENPANNYVKGLQFTFKERTHGHPTSVTLSSTYEKADDEIKEIIADVIDDSFDKLIMKAKRHLAKLEKDFAAIKD